MDGGDWSFACDLTLASREKGTQGVLESHDDGISRLAFTPATGECAVFRGTALGVKDHWGDVLCVGVVAFSVREGTLEDFVAGRCPAHVIVLYFDESLPMWHAEAEATARVGWGCSEVSVPTDLAAEGRWCVQIRFVDRARADRLLRAR